MYIFFNELINKYKYLIIIFIVIIIGILSYVFTNHNNDLNNEIIDLSTIQDEEEFVLNIVNKVDIKGAVNNPGVYKFEDGDRVIDAIILAGGLKEEADTSTINLSKNLNNEMVIIIYSKDEIKQLTKGDTVIKVVDKECICPKVENKACIDKNNLVDNLQENNNNNKININTAGVEELTKLPGIGESKAKAIIKYREDNNGFKSIEEITNVSGIGNSTFEKIQSYITI